MEAERWHKVERLYHALAVEESRRDDFLEDSCAGDETLRNEVETLLACHGKAEQFIEVPAREAMAKVLAGEEGEPSPSAGADDAPAGRTISYYSGKTQIPISPFSSYQSRVRQRELTHTSEKP